MCRGYIRRAVDGRRAVLTADRIEESSAVAACFDHGVDSGFRGVVREQLLDQLRDGVAVFKHLCGEFAFTRLKELGTTPADVGQGDVPWTVMADPEGNEFCVLDPRPFYQDTGPIAAVVVDCADPRAMARFWGKAMDWTLHEVTDHNAILCSAKGVGPYLQFIRTPDVKTVWNRVHLDVRPYPRLTQDVSDGRVTAEVELPLKAG